jgi:uncharacterized damage-inducible protein DinB
MYTAEALVDLHERGHRSLQKLLKHCRQFSAEELNRKSPGFGHPSIRLQLCHVIAAEDYWAGVLRGSFNVEDKEAEYTTVASLEAYRKHIVAATDGYLSTASFEELNTARPMLTWQSKERILLPAHVIMRMVTHIYQHQGQVLAMCRLMDKPAEGMDFPIAE